ncbi:hypothetical protein GLW05_20890 [Pontibacillus yanchengensis]|uniref:Uncharacterized protein n=1 Tax=Pontibacillus yanchengensis TaxID=462910 RepID=A0A6I5A6K9_9BACI|nr:hypothetical protein [Pontibacillus yanchengensis]MYL36031.1 hypothetical protein [Pontibacillus yanchengensis]
MAIKYITYVDDKGNLRYKNVTENGENVVVTDENGKITDEYLNPVEIDLSEVISKIDNLKVEHQVIIDDLSMLENTDLSGVENDLQTLSNEHADMLVKLNSLENTDLTEVLNDLDGLNVRQQDVLSKVNALENADLSGVESTLSNLNNDHDTIFNLLTEINNKDFSVDLTEVYNQLANLNSEHSSIITMLESIDVGNGSTDVDLTEVTNKLDVMQQEHADILTAINDIETGSGGETVDLTELHNKLDSITSDLSNVLSKVTTLENTDLSGIESSLTTLSTNVDSILSKVNTLENTDLSGVEDSMSTVDNKVDNVDLKVDDVLQDLSFIRDNYVLGKVIIKDVLYNSSDNVIEVTYDSNRDDMKIVFIKSNVEVNLNKGDNLTVSIGLDDLVVNALGQVNEDVEIRNNTNGELVSVYKIVETVDYKPGQIIVDGLKLKETEEGSVLEYDYEMLDNVVSDGELNKQDIVDVFNIAFKSIDLNKTYDFNIRDGNFYPANSSMDYYVDLVLDVEGEKEFTQVFEVNGEVRQERIFNVVDYSLNDEGTQLNINYTSMRNDVELVLNSFNVGQLDDEGTLTVSLSDLGEDVGGTAYVDLEIIETSTSNVLQSYGKIFELIVGEKPKFNEPDNYDSTVLTPYRYPTIQELKDLGITVTDNEDGDLTDNINIEHYDAFTTQEDVFIDLGVVDSDNNHQSLYVKFDNSGFKESGRDEYVVITKVEENTSMEEFRIVYDTFANSLKIDIYLDGSKIGDKYLDDYVGGGVFYINWSDVGYTGSETGIQVAIDVIRDGTVIESKKTVNLT